MLQQLTKNSYKLCCRNGCPTITFENKIVKIKDDFGAEIVIQLDEAELIEKAIKNFQKNKS